MVGVFYGGEWHAVKEGTFGEGIEIAESPGHMAVYQDPFNEEIIFLLEPIGGYRIKKPTPPEPQATVTELHSRK